MGPVQRRRQIAIKEKKKIRKYRANNPRLLQEDIIEWYKSISGIELSTSTIASILSSTNSHLDDSKIDRDNNKRLRDPQFPEIERALVEVLFKYTNIGIPAFGKISEVGKYVSTKIPPRSGCPKFSSGWQDKFKKRNLYKERCLKGKAASFYSSLKIDPSELYQTTMSHSQKVPSINQAYHHEPIKIDDADRPSAEENLQSFLEKIALYSPENVFTMNETILSYRAAPTDSHIKNATKSLGSGETVSIMLCYNASGTEKMEPWVIGSSDPTKKPECSSETNSSNVHYFTNSIAWVGIAEFEKWLLWFDSKMEGRQVLLVLDPFKAHEVASRMLGHPLKNVSLHFSPGFLANRYLPPDLGAIYTFKALYRQTLLEDFSFQPKDIRFKRAHNSVDIKRALDWITRAWEETACDVLKDSWTRSGLLCSPGDSPPSIDGLQISSSKILLSASHPSYVPDDLLYYINLLISVVYRHDSRDIHAEDILSASSFVSHEAEYFEESPFQFLDIAIAPFKPLSERVTEEYDMKCDNAETTDEQYSDHMGEVHMDLSLNINRQDQRYLARRPSPLIRNPSYGSSATDVYCSTSSNHESSHFINHQDQRDLTRRPSLSSRNPSYGSSATDVYCSTSSNHGSSYFGFPSHSRLDSFDNPTLGMNPLSYNPGSMPGTPNGTDLLFCNPPVVTSATQSPMGPYPTTRYNSYFEQEPNPVHSGSQIMSLTENFNCDSTAPVNSFDTTASGNETMLFQLEDLLPDYLLMTDRSQPERAQDNFQCMRATNLPNNEGFDIDKFFESRLEKEDQNTENTSILSQSDKQENKLLSKVCKFFKKRKPKKGKKE